PSFERDLEQPIAGSLPVTPAARLVVTEGNYLLLADGDWGQVRPQLTEVWFCELPEAERIRRLVKGTCAWARRRPSPSPGCTAPTSATPTWSPAPATGPTWSWARRSWT